MFLYADDANICRPICSSQDCEILQSDLEKPEKWSKKWLLNFNINKCKVMNISRAPNLSFCYTLDNPLESISKFSDLGLNVTNTLSWRTHILKIVSKANRLQGFIKRTLGTKVRWNYQNLYNVVQQGSYLMITPLITRHVCTI